MGEEQQFWVDPYLPTAIATIAYHATLESYGVVGLAPRNLADGIVHTITREPMPWRIRSL